MSDEYFLVDLENRSLIGSAGPLPYIIENWSSDTVADLDAAGLDPSAGYSGKGFFLTQKTTPSFDSDTQALDGTYYYVLDFDNKRVQATANIRNLTNDELTANLTNVQNSKYNDINDYRDTYIANGFNYNNVNYQTDDESIKNVMGMSSAAISAITIEQVKIGNLRWFSPNVDFAWIATDNSRHTMDAFDMIKFAKIIGLFKSGCILYANGLKQYISTIKNIKVARAFDITKNWPSNSYSDSTS